MDGFYLELGFFGTKNIKNPKDKKKKTPKKTKKTKRKQNKTKTRSENAKKCLQNYMCFIVNNITFKLLLEMLYIRFVYI